VGRAGRFTIGEFREREGDHLTGDEREVFERDHRRTGVHCPPTEADLSGRTRQRWQK
jgi:hypothetical protein